jgi:hypothetical protein
MFKLQILSTKRTKISLIVRFQSLKQHYVVFFLSEGKAGYVLSKYQDMVYLEILKGELFGHIDLANTKIFMKA